MARMLPLRLRRVVVGALALLLLLATVSYVRALTYPGSASWSDRSVEWVRDHGGSPVVDAVENSNFTGPPLVPFRYKGDEHGGLGGVQMGSVKNGKIVLTGQPETTDPGTGPIKPYTQQQPAPPANGVG